MYKSIVSLAVVASISAPVAFAAEEGQNLERIQVIGSRIALRTATDSPTPVDIITSEQLEATGITETAKALQFAAPSYSFPFSSITDGSDAVRPASLRGMSPDHTLVLVNGKRRHGSALVHLSGTVGKGSSNVDLNAIPMTSIKRIEILRDGASALYGSDAIAGVINVVLKDSDHGGSIATQIGQTYEGDGEQVRIGVNQGFSISDDGFVNVSLEAHQKNSTNRAGLDTRQQYPTLADGSLDPREDTFNRKNHHVGDSDYENYGLFVNAEQATTDTNKVYAHGFNATLDAYQINVDDRIILSGSVDQESSPVIAAALAGTNAESARFFMNAVDTQTQGVDLVMTQDFDLGQFGDVMANLAYSYKETEIKSVNLPTLLNGLEDELFDRVEEIRMTEATSKHSGNIGFTHKYDDFTTNLRFSYFGDYTIGYSSSEVNYDAKWTTDISTRYQATDSLAVTLGVQNLFDTYPEKRPEDNNFNGIFVYPLTNTPFGFNGGYYYLDLRYTY
ncbi:TonB-dependent siderophore receptor [Shewanella sp. MEBiC00475]|uniref:TonB-dependent receptor plug domain-containing protein n=1 Tax=Shewanella sp. MEBiC00475 TaxID=2575361 RepID=UPI0010C04EE0|nr:TonB-dependent receptor [Shewanella sp. MEBiC00475]